LHAICPKKINKMPEFYMIFTRKIFSRFFGGWQVPPLPLRLLCLWLTLSSSSLSSLASCAGANNVQARHPSVPVHPRTGAGLLSWLSTAACCSNSRSTATSFIPTSALSVPLTRLCTIGDRAFPVAAAKAWNSLPVEVTSAQSLQTFKSKLKTRFFLSHSCNFPFRPTSLL